MYASANTSTSSFIFTFFYSWFGAERFLHSFSCIYIVSFRCDERAVWMQYSLFDTITKSLFYQNVMVVIIATTGIGNRGKGTNMESIWNSCFLLLVPRTLPSSAMTCGLGRDCLSLFHRFCYENVKYCVAMQLLLMFVPRI